MSDPSKTTEVRTSGRFGRAWTRKSGDLPCQRNSTRAGCPGKEHGHGIPVCRDIGRDCRSATHRCAEGTWATRQTKRNERPSARHVYIKTPIANRVMRPLKTCGLPQWHHKSRYCERCWTDTQRGWLVHVLWQADRSPAIVGFGCRTSYGRGRRKRRGQINAAAVDIPLFPANQRLCVY